MEQIPLEYEEQVAVVEYLELRGHKFTAIPNDVYTNSHKQKAKKRREGLRAGLPDLFVIIGDQALFIEMKRRKRGVVSQDQQAWIDAINKTQVKAYVCRGADEAIEIIRRYETKLNQ